MIIRKRRGLSFCLALVAGVFFGLGFAPYNWFQLSFVAIALFYGIVFYSSDLKESLILGFLFGLALFSSSVPWIFYSIQSFTEASIWVSLSITSLFILVQGSFFSLLTAAFSLLFANKKPTVAAIGFSLLWGIVEALRSHFLGGFPWLLAGDLHSHGPFKALLPIIGSPATGVFFVFLACLFTQGLIKLNSIKRVERTNGFLALAFMMALFMFPLGLQNMKWTSPKSHKAVPITLIQANVSELKKQQESEIVPILKTYNTLSQKVKDSEIIIWPESILSFTESSILFLLDPLYQQIKKEHKTLILGLPTEANVPQQYYNSLIKIGETTSYYHKVHLVPFGEYMPINGLKSLLNHLKLDYPLFMKGTVLSPIKTSKISFIPFICYDVAFSEHANQIEADALITLTDDAWFGHSHALYQHQQMAMIRAIEQGREHLFISNNGLTSLIDVKGQIKASAPLYNQEALDVNLTTYKGSTPWHKFGYRRYLLTLFTLFLMFLFA